MTASPRILCLAGSLRGASLNKKLAQSAARLVQEHGGEATYIDIADYPLPLFNEDISEIPEHVLRMKSLFCEHDGIFLASPEYNGHYTGVLKNLLDWMSRPTSVNEAPLSAFNGKVFGLSSVSPGPLGGLRGLIALRACLGCVPCHIAPSQAAIGKGSGAFDDDGRIIDERPRAMLESCVKEMIALSHGLRRVHASS